MTCPGVLNLGIGARAFDSVVERIVVIGAVTIVFTVGFVVLVVVRDQIGGGEPVVRCDEVDRRPWATAAAGKDVLRTGEARRDLPDAGAAVPELANGAAVLVVPFRPLESEVSDLVTVGSGIPRFGDELAPGQYRIGGDGRQDGRPLVEAAAARPTQRAREIESEAVDTHFGGPVAEAVGDHADGDGGAGVDRVAAPGQVDVAAVAVEKVIAGAVQTSPADTDSVDTLLAGVVVDDVEDDLDACRV
jgi:hypothetical protein